MNLGPTGEVISATGEVLPDRSRSPTRPRLGERAATLIAAEWQAREAGLSPREVAVRSEGLAIHDSPIMGGRAAFGPRLVWQVEARVEGGAADEPLQRLVLVDALGGQVITSIERIAHLDRRVCDFRDVTRLDYRCKPVYTRRGGQPPSGVSDVDAAHRRMGSAHAFYSTVLGRDSIDGAGAPLVVTVRYCPIYGCPMNNAYWRWSTQQAL